MSILLQGRVTCANSERGYKLEEGLDQVLLGRTSMALWDIGLLRICFRVNTDPGVGGSSRINGICTIIPFICSLAKLLITLTPKQMITSQ